MSREKAKRAETWNVLEKLYENNEIVTGLISGKVKGGFTVDIGSVRAFLPGSLVDTRPVRDTAHLEGKELEFKVIKLDQNATTSLLAAALWWNLKTQQSAKHYFLTWRRSRSGRRGENLTDYGAFVDLGGIDGLLHITDMAWRRIKHPSEVVEVGQELKS